MYSYSYEVKTTGGGGGVLSNSSYSEIEKNAKKIFLVASQTGLIIYQKLLTI